MNRFIASFRFVVIGAFLLGCASHQPANSASKDATSQEIQRLYVAWHQEIAAQPDSSGPSTMVIRLPSFRSMVAMGKPALPFLKQKLEENKGEDCFLAFAVVEIYGWDSHDFAGYHGAQEFRANVLRKMEDEK
jgi:hypothetical protein